MAVPKKREKAAKKPAEKKAGAAKEPQTKKQPAKKAALKPKAQAKPTAKKARPKVQTAPEKEVIAQVSAEKVSKDAPKPKVEHKIERISFLPPKTASARRVPKFHRQEYLRYKKLDKKWRVPTGIDSKKLVKKRGKGLLPSIGYKKPASLSGLHCGFKAVRVFNAEELKKVNPPKEAAIIAAAVGRLKRNMMIDAANKLGITILNPRRGEA